MTGKPIDAKMINNLLHAKQSGRVAEEDRPENKWPGPINMKRLAKAVASKAPVVVFNNGSHFYINYDLDENSVLIKPSTGFIPMGWFSYARLRDIVAGVH